MPLYHQDGTLSITNAGRYGDGMDVESRLVARSASLTPSERRIGETVLASPQLVAFGTVADVAEAARVGTATVVRFAVKLGFDGYTELQASVQHDLAGQLRPAVERIRDQATADDAALDRHVSVEVGNVRRTLDAVDADVLRSVVSRLADDTRPVLVLSGVASAGVAVQFVGDLEQLRPAVRLLDGNGIDIIRTLALAGADATLVVLDLRRYERWLLDAANLARDAACGSPRSATACCRRCPHSPTPRSWCRPLRPDRSTATSAPWRCSTCWWSMWPWRAATTPPSASTCSRRRGVTPTP